MKWFSALLCGAIFGFVLPMFFGGPGGPWLESFFGTGTIRPIKGSPGLLFSVPLAVFVAFGFRTFFSWHNG